MNKTYKMKRIDWRAYGIGAAIVTSLDNTEMHIYREGGKFVLRLITDLGWTKAFDYTFFNTKEEAVEKVKSFFEYKVSQYMEELS